MGCNYRTAGWPSGLEPDPGVREVGREGGRTGRTRDPFCKRCQRKVPWGLEALGSASWIK